MPHHFFVDWFCICKDSGVYRLNECSWMSALCILLILLSQEEWRREEAAKQTPAVQRCHGCFQAGGLECSRRPAMTRWEIHHRFIIIYTHLFERQMKTQRGDEFEIFEPGMKSDSKPNLGTLLWVLLSFKVTRWTHTDLKVVKSLHLLVNPEFIAWKFTGSIL